MKIFISKIALLLFMLLGANVCYANDNISVQSLSITPGESCEIVILFNGESYSGMYSGCQFDLTIPEKLSVATTKKGKNYIVNSSEITSGDVVASSHSFTVSVKEVRNSRLLRIVKWDIYDGRGMWRYSTDTMSGDHDAVLMAPNQIFEFCMKRLGWTYQRDGMYYR